jgi:hypothetical protein
MADLAADTVAERLRDRAARSATLAALESGGFASAQE